MTIFALPPPRRTTRYEWFALRDVCHYVPALEPLRERVPNARGRIREFDRPRRRGAAPSASGNDARPTLPEASYDGLVPTDVTTLGPSDDASAWSSGTAVRPARLRPSRRSINKASTRVHSSAKTS